MSFLSSEPFENVDRCDWVGADPLYIAYHDFEWGVPVTDDRLLFEHLCLEAAQAGLSWITILRKRENYRRAFAEFDPHTVSRMTSSDVSRLLDDAGIVRNRKKIEATIQNAARFIDIQVEWGSFYNYSLSFLNGAPRVNRRRTMKDVPASTPESAAFARDLKHRGFRFLGPTTLYAHMQACGLVNDHTVNCFRHAACQKLLSQVQRPSLA